MTKGLSARAAKLAEPDDVTFERDQAEWRERMADALPWGRSRAIDPSRKGVGTDEGRASPGPAPFAIRGETSRTS